MNNDERAIQSNPVSPGAHAIIALLCVSAIVLFYGRFTSDSSTVRFLIDHALGTDRSADLTPFRDEDARWRSASGGRPIALSFVGFRADDPMDRFFVAQRYFRCVYALFPAAVHVAPDGVIINDARVLIGSPLAVDEPGMRAAGIVAHIIVEKRADGSINTTVVRPTGELP
jgi:hypothetical protein